MIVTQGKVLLVDCYDSFTYNLKDYLEQAGACVEVVSCDHSPSNVALEDYDGLVLSPGPGRPKDKKSGFLMEYISLAWDTLPMLGICLGAQAIGVHLGVRLLRQARPMHGKISEVYCTSESKTISKLPSKFKVVRYHSLILEECPKEAELLLKTAKNELMAFEIKEKSILGIQFHPEAWETDYGLQLLQNWLRRCFKIDI